MKKFVGTDQVLSTKVDGAKIYVKLKRRDGSVYWKTMRLTEYDVVRVLDRTCDICQGTGEGSPRECGRCNGTGVGRAVRVYCSRCKGKGKTSVGRKVKSKITCPTCYGTGSSRPAVIAACEFCNGQGLVFGCAKCCGTGYL